MTAARKLTVYKAFSQQLAQFEAEYGSELIQCETPTGMKAAKDSRKDIRDVRSNLEDLRKETKAPILAKGIQIDAEAKVIKEKLDVLFNKFDKAIKAIENKAAIAKQEKLDAALDKIQELEAREAAIKAKEIELGLREPDEDIPANSDNADGGTAGNDGGSGDTDSIEATDTLSSPHIKAAATRLTALKRVRDLVEPTDAQPDSGEIDDKIAVQHDQVLASIWEIVDEFQ